MKAPEFPQNLRWLNLPPDKKAGLRIAELRGQPVLVDFWTYSCVNCIRTLPHLKDWHKKYSNKGLTIIGVHTPEFEFEKDIQNVEAALREFEIEYPVVMDNDYQIWSLYSNKFWPAKYLIDKEGKIVYKHFGEGNYTETEKEIQKVILEADKRYKLPPIDEESDGTGGICYPATPETYLGSLRGKIGGIWNAVGAWKVYPEYIEHLRTIPTYSDYISLKFEAFEVNLVMGGIAEKPFILKLELNGDKLPDVEAQRYKMYNLVKSKKLLKGELKIFVKDAGFKAYAFTFGGCV